ncbi:MAG TPA: GxxExxY protein [Vicinamibacterales bacterium]
MNELDAISGRIIGAAIRVHKKFGPGLLESVYTPCLGHELVSEGLDVEIGKALSLQHEGLTIDRAYVLDLLVEGQVIVEVKCVSKIAPIHTAQLLTYLRLMNLQLGLIINFNVTKLVDGGIKRVVNNYEEEDRTPESVKGPRENEPTRN